MESTYFMRDMVDANQKVHSITWGGICEFFAHPNGIISTGLDFLNKIKG